MLLLCRLDHTHADGHIHDSVLGATTEVPGVPRHLNYLGWSRTESHVQINRMASFIVTVSDIQDANIDHLSYPILGYHEGTLVSNRIPIVVGIESLDPSTDDLKDFGAAFATVSGASMFHLVGVAPSQLISRSYVPLRTSLTGKSLNFESSAGRVGAACWDEYAESWPQ